MRENERQICTAAPSRSRERTSSLVMDRANEPARSRIKLTLTAARCSRAVPVWRRTHAEIDASYRDTGAERRRRDLRRVT